MSKLKCLICEKQGAQQYYKGLTPVAVLCSRCAVQHLDGSRRFEKLTPLIKNAQLRQVQTALALA